MAQDKFEKAIDLDKRLQGSRWAGSPEVEKAPKSPSKNYAGFLRMQQRGEFSNRKRRSTK